MIKKSYKTLNIGFNLALNWCKNLTNFYSKNPYLLKNLGKNPLKFLAILAKLFSPLIITKVISILSIWLEFSINIDLLGEILISSVFLSLFEVLMPSYPHFPWFWRVNYFIVRIDLFLTKYSLNQNSY